MRALGYLSLALVGLAGLAAGQPKASAPKQRGTAPRAPDLQWKAIWEPVPFNQDIELTAISCPGPETCWVAGRKSTILFTSDGARTWQVQLGGDPEAADEDLAAIFFLDEKHGWVMTQRSRTMGTTDGHTWAELGRVPATARGLWFLTPDIGLVADRHDSQSRTHLNHTKDGGRTWTRGNPCGVDAVINGLPRKLGCMARAIQFISATTGFMGGGAPIDMGAEVGVFSRTTDGGATWIHSLIPGTKHAVDAIHFWSEKDGVAVLSSGQTYWTADAGATWTGSVNSPPWRSFYASGEGKTVVGVSEGGRQIGYSFDGGKSFTLRPAGLPALVRGVAFPTPRHGYLVGQHGMVYRYRIVPASYQSEGMFGAPAPPQ